MATWLTSSEGGNCDYDYDFSEEEKAVLDALLADAEKRVDGPLAVEVKIDNAVSPETSVPLLPSNQRWTSPASCKEDTPTLTPSHKFSVHFAGINQTVASCAKDLSQSIVYATTSRGNSEGDRLDQRSPIDRFRSKPKRALSVTDLVSPSWCELQYLYTLEKYGKKRATHAMRQGSAIHKTLELQVHETVEVAVESREDAWGLKIWNVVSGLRTLRHSGVTRELELWGVLNGQVVNGVVDELSYVCPDVSLDYQGPTESGKPRDNVLAASAARQEFSDSSGTENRSLHSTRERTSRIYLTDVKTRGTPSIPRGPSFRPTLFQLMLYHLLLSDLVTDNVNPNIIFEHYDLRPNINFSDSFVTQIVEFTRDLSHETLRLLSEHSSLYLLWRLMIQEFQYTFPRGVESVGNVLKAEYRDQIDGTILGMKTFLYDKKIIEEYVKDEIKWWKGEREARGVCIEEAFKCKTCEFADRCDWRIRKNEDLQAARKLRSHSIV